MCRRISTSTKEEGWTTLTMSSEGRITYGWVMGCIANSVSNANHRHTALITRMVQKEGKLLRNTQIKKWAGTEYEAGYQLQLKGKDGQH